MDSQRLELKVDKMAEDITEIKVTMAENTESLKTHMYRTDLNERAINLMQETFTPIIAHVNFVHNLAKTIVFITKVLSGLAAIASIFATLHLFHIL